MPWKMSDAALNTKKANTPAKKKQFASVANAVLKKTGDDVKALKIAKAAVKKHPSKKSPKTAVRKKHTTLANARFSDEV
jgi:hypothetical protein